jgi:hypothetical protein
VYQDESCSCCSGELAEPHQHHLVSFNHCQNDSQNNPENNPTKQNVARPQYKFSSKLSTKKFKKDKTLIHNPLVRGVGQEKPGKLVFPLLSKLYRKARDFGVGSYHSSEE